MSKMFVRPFRPEDLERLDLQNVQAKDLELIGDPLAVLSCGEAWTMIAGERGRPETQTVRACAGLIYFTQWRAKAWSLMGRDLTKREWAFAVQKMGARLTELQEFKCLRRVEAETLLDFAPGHMLLLRLGFRFACVLPAAGHDGAAHALFERLRDRVTAQELVRYERCRQLGYSMVIEDVIEKRYHRRAA